jgi:hypothetical protein
MKGGGVRFLGAQCRSDGHLRHHRGAAAANEAFINQANRGAVAGRSDSGVHPGAPRADDENICGEMGHEFSLALGIADFKLQTSEISSKPYL